MADRDARKVDARRWHLTIVRHLEDLPRQYAALENAMAAFGEDRDLQQFKAAYDTTEDMDAYNRVQAVERAVGHVQNYVGELADAGAKLVGLPRPPTESDGSRAHHAFEALLDAGVIGRGLCNKLMRARALERESSTAMSRRRRSMSIAPRCSYRTQHVTS